MVLYPATCTKYIRFDFVRSRHNKVKQQIERKGRIDVDTTRMTRAIHKNSEMSQLPTHFVSSYLHSLLSHCSAAMSLVRICIAFEIKLKIVSIHVHRFIYYPSTRVKGKLNTRVQWWPTSVAINALNAPNNGHGKEIESAVSRDRAY